MIFIYTHLHYKPEVFLLVVGRLLGHDIFSIATLDLHLHKAENKDCFLA